MSPAIIDTLAISKRLQSAGYNQLQADAQAEIWADVVEDKLATKRDLKELRLGMYHEFKEMELRLTLRLGGMMVVGIGIVATLVKLL